MAVESKVKKSKLLEQQSPVICGPRLLREIGRAPAIFVQKLHYWLITEGDHIGHYVDGRRWIDNTHEAWTESIGIYCAKTIYRATKKLEKMGIISSKKINAKKGKHQKAYTINYDVLYALCPWLSQEAPDMDSSINKEKIQENVHIEKEQNVQIINGKHRSTNIPSITSRENVANKQVGSLAKPSRKEKTSKPEIKEGKLTEANKIIYQLVEIYNKHVGEGKVILNKKLARWIMAAFQKLGSCLKKWENFCKRIATSDWLMGRVTNGFKASLTWLLKFNIMDRILGGDFKCKEPYEEAPIPTEDDEQQLIQEIEASEASTEEQSVKKTLLKAFGVTRFKSYFAQAKVKLEQDRVILLVESMFHRDQIDTPSMWAKIMALYPSASLKVEG